MFISSNITIKNYDNSLIDNFKKCKMQFLINKCKIKLICILYIQAFFTYSTTGYKCGFIHSLKFHKISIPSTASFCTLAFT